MITVICGDDVSASRKYLGELREKYLSDGYEVVAIPFGDVETLVSTIESTASLFSDERVFMVDNVLGKKAGRDRVNSVDSGAPIVIWEEKLTEREIKFSMPKATIKSFSLPHNLWKLLDSVTTKNLINSQKLLAAVISDDSEGMILYMLQKRMKDLILAQENLSARKLQPWQVTRLKEQARRWDKARLKQMYGKLYEIEKGTKTGSLAYSVADSLDILFCFYLQ